MKFLKMHSITVTKSVIMKNVVIFSVVPPRIVDGSAERRRDLFVKKLKDKYPGNDAEFQTVL